MSDRKRASSRPLPLEPRDSSWILKIRANQISLHRNGEYCVDLFVLPELTSTFCTRNETDIPYARKRKRANPTNAAVLFVITWRLFSKKLSLSLSLFHSSFCLNAIRHFECRKCDLVQLSATSSRQKYCLSMKIHRKFRKSSRDVDKCLKPTLVN